MGSQAKRLNRSVVLVLWLSTPPAAAAAGEVIRGWGPGAPRPGSRADGGRLPAPETLCRTPAPRAPHTKQGNPPADEPWI